MKTYYSTKYLHASNLLMIQCNLYVNVIKTHMQLSFLLTIEPLTTCTVHSYPRGLFMLQ